MKYSHQIIDIIYHFLTMLYFYYILISFIAELHMLPHLTRFYHNNTLPCCILSF